MTSHYVVRCATCDQAAVTDNFADGEAWMVIHQASTHPEADQKIIRPLAAALQLAIERVRS
jgi:hypothetical protein